MSLFDAIVSNIEGLPCSHKEMMHPRGNGLMAGHIASCQTGAEVRLMGRRLPRHHHYRHYIYMYFHTCRPYQQLDYRKLN